MVPSVKTLLRIPGLSREDAVRLRKVLDGRLAPQDVDPRIEREHVGARYGETRNFHVKELEKRS